MDLPKIIDFAYEITGEKDSKKLSWHQIVRPPPGPLPEVAPGGHIATKIYVHCPSDNYFWLGKEFYPLSSGDDPRQTVVIRYEAKNREGTTVSCRIETIWDKGVRLRTSTLFTETLPANDRVTPGGEYNLGGNRDNVVFFSTEDLEAQAFMFLLATALRYECMMFGASA